jgi:hypothetical protein
MKSRFQILQEAHYPFINDDSIYMADMKSFNEVIDDAVAV